MENNGNNRFLLGVLTGICGMLIVFSISAIVLFLNYKVMLLPVSGKNVQGTDVEDSANAQSGTNKTGIKSNMDKIVSKLDVLEGYINKYYLYDTDSVDFTDGICKGLIGSLDDVYSVYYSKEDYDKLKEQTSGNYCGLGAYVSQDPDTGQISILQVIKDSPAEDIGLQTGDIIYAVDGQLAAEKDLSTVVSWLKGIAGTSAELEYYRDGEKHKATFTRREIETESVAFEMLKDSIGYIQVSTFADSTTHQFCEAVDELEKKGAKGFIIDLRDNGGGLLDVSTDMANYILDSGLIVSTKTKAGVESEVEADAEHCLDAPVIVLINGNSASASEVFAGALKDHNKAVLVGTKSFGKGIVQTLFPLNDGSAVKITTSEYFTPSGKNIQGTGIEPDVNIELDKDALKDGYEKEKDSQLNKALEVMKRKLQ